jgi:hypothetical protein
MLIPRLLQIMNSIVKDVGSADENGIFADPVPER